MSPRARVANVAVFPWNFVILGGLERVILGSRGLFLGYFSDYISLEVDTRTISLAMTLELPIFN